MQEALGLSGEAATMFAIMVALGVAGIVALFMALFWPTRWRISYRLEIAFAVLLTALAIYGDLSSAATYQAYERDLRNEALAGKATGEEGPEAFDRTVTVYAYQWGFVFIGPEGGASRNAVMVEPGERVLFNILSNDVIHGFDIPAARIITEVDPGSVRSIWIRAPERPGKYLIQCVDYCGVGHHQMKAWLVVKGDAEQGHAEHG
jgi:heme/copper-type cytochrome/quinol oxidase subunit 2